MFNGSYYFSGIRSMLWFLALFQGLLFFNTATGQGIVSEDNDWNVLMEEFGGGNYYADTEILYFEGDSSVDGYDYKILWHSYYNTGSTYFGGLLREDSNRVFYILGEAEEGLLYDFNAEVGDTLNIINCFNPYEPFEVYITDTDIAEYYGIERKRWFLEDAYGNTDCWIEGIGSSSGPVHTMQRGSPPYLLWNLICYFNLDTLLYKKEGYSQCIYFYTDIDEFPEEEQVHIYPNPACGNFTVECQCNNIDKIQIYDLIGRKVLESVVNGERSVIVDCSLIQPGIYLCKTQVDDQWTIGRLIIR